MSDNSVRTAKHYVWNYVRAKHYWKLMVTYPVETNQNNGLQFGKCKPLLRTCKPKKWIIKQIYESKLPKISPLH